MTTMLARLQGASQAQRRFVADASHELRSPLATVRAVAELSCIHPEVLPWAEAAQTVLSEARRLEALVGDLLLARSDEHGPAVRRRDVDLDDVAAAEVSRLRHPGRLHVVADVAPVRVSGDGRHLARAVRNLVDNAERHATSTVTVRLGAVTVEVAWRAWRSPTTGSASPPTSARGSSSASCATTAESAPAVAPGWGWPSPDRSPASTAATWWPAQVMREGPSCC